MKSHLLSTGPSSFPCPASRQVTERYSQDGRAARFKRRDLRSGERVWRLLLHFTSQILLPCGCRLCACRGRLCWSGKTCAAARVCVCMHTLMLPHTWSLFCACTLHTTGSRVALATHNAPSCLVQAHMRGRCSSAWQLCLATGQLHALLCRRCLLLCPSAQPLNPPVQARTWGACSAAPPPAAGCCESSGGRPTAATAATTSTWRQRVRGIRTVGAGRGVRAWPCACWCAFALLGSLDQHLAHQGTPPGRSSNTAALLSPLVLQMCCTWTPR